MKPASIFLTVIALLGVSAMTMAFMNQHNAKKAIEKLQTMDNNKGFAVVELFTSEGCSSCPPADALLEKLQQDNKNQQLYILAFHVDYWDHQGWKDRFSQHQFSERQLQYVNWLRLSTAYTPQIVINGNTEYVGSDQGPILGTIYNSLQRETANTLALKATVADNKVHVSYEGVEEDKQNELVLALVQKNGESNVKAGENEGRHLSHVQIVREFKSVDVRSKKEVTLNLPGDFNVKNWELIGFVQDKRDGHITNAARAAFN